MTSVTTRPFIRPRRSPMGPAASVAGVVFARPAPPPTLGALLSTAGLPRRIRVTHSFLRVEAGSVWEYDDLQGAHVDARGADRVLLPAVARAMLRRGDAVEDQP